MPVVEIPYGAYWSTPFCRWQGSFASLHSIEFAAEVTRREIAKRAIDVDLLEHAVLGFSVPQKHSFYGMPWLAGAAGLGHLAGPTLMQACATGVRCLLSASQEIQMQMAGAALVVTCDRTSNGPHLYYPGPLSPGGTGVSEDWVLGNFGCDPLGGNSMLATAENVARKHGISTREQHEVVLLREAQYREALRDDSEFLKRFMTLPFEIGAGRSRRAAPPLEGDEGVNHSTVEGLDRLQPILPDGTVTFGGQTHPADGNAGLIVADSSRARSLSRDPSIVVRLCGFGQARVPLAYMPEAPLPAAQKALSNAGLTIDRIDAIKTHNPFALNDVVFARETGRPIEKMNNFGCSLVWGHPQAPMGTRAVIELIEELVIRGGGYGLFAGCAAGDSAMAVVVHVDDRRSSPSTRQGNSR